MECFKQEILHDVWGLTGFLPNTKFIYKANTPKGDDHGELNSNIFVKWTRKKLILNIPKNADNAFYHTVQINKTNNR